MRAVGESELEEHVEAFAAEFEVFWDGVCCEVAANIDMYDLDMIHAYEHNHRLHCDNPRHVFTLGQQVVLKLWTLGHLVAGGTGPCTFHSYTVPSGLVAEEELLGGCKQWVSASYLLPF